MHCPGTASSLSIHVFTSASSAQLNSTARSCSTPTAWDAKNPWKASTCVTYAARDCLPPPSWRHTFCAIQAHVLTSARNVTPHSPSPQNWKRTWKPTRPCVRLLVATTAGKLSAFAAPAPRTRGKFDSRLSYNSIPSLSDLSFKEHIWMTANGYTSASIAPNPLWLQATAGVIRSSTTWPATTGTCDTICQYM